MKAEFQQRLITEFPQFFISLDSPGPVYLECSDGWFKLIYRMCQDIVKTNVPKEFMFIQVKEKFGGLRVYTMCSTEKIDGIIDKAEEMSFNICELCGRVVTAKQRLISMWVRTMCIFCWYKIKIQKYVKGLI